MKVLVLGASGFLGSWAVRALCADAHEVVIFQRPSSDGWRLAGMTGIAELKFAPAEWPREIERLIPDVILSLDWEGVSAQSRDDPEVQARNLSRQSAIIQAAIRAGVSRFVGIGSQAEYGRMEGKTAENALSLPSTEYGRVKVEVLHLLREMADAAALEWVWARVFSVYGPLEGNGWLLPVLADSARRRMPMSLTEATQPWSYLFAADAGTALATLTSHPGARGIYNLASPLAEPLRHSLEIFAGALGATDLLRFGEVTAKSPAGHLDADVSRLVSLGWDPHTTLEAGLELPASWLTGVPVADPFHHERFLPVRPASSFS